MYGSRESTGVLALSWPCFSAAGKRGQESATLVTDLGMSMEAPVLPAGDVARVGQRSLAAVDTSFDD